MEISGSENQYNFCAHKLTLPIKLSKSINPLTPSVPLIEIHPRKYLHICTRNSWKKVCCNIHIQSEKYENNQSAHQEKYD